MLFSKNKGKSITELGDILRDIETDESLIGTLVETYKVLEHLQDKHYNTNSLNPINYIRPHKKGGGIIFINYNENKSKAQINGSDAIKIPPNEQYSIYDKKGKKQLEKILFTEELNDGAVEIDGKNGNIKSCRRRLIVTSDEVAVKRGLVKKGEDASYKTWGFAKSVFTKHENSIAFSYEDPEAYLFTFSEETGDIRLMHNKEIIYSSLPQEIPNRLAVYLNPAGKLYARREAFLSRIRDHIQPERALSFNFSLAPVLFRDSKNY